MSNWSLYEKEKELNPIKFSNGKTQEDIVRETLQAVKEGYKVIFIKGMCGSGKSAMALNIAKELGRASIVVPIKNLQKQYEEDYTHKKYLLKKDGGKLKIKSVKGRNNFQCCFLKENRMLEKKEADSKLGKFLDPFDKPTENKNKDEESCDNSFIPCKIEIKEKNSKKIREYLRQNKKIRSDNIHNLRRVRRMSIAPVCPYWSPIIESSIKVDQLEDAAKMVYRGLMGADYTFYRRKSGCGYYDQYQDYINADVLIFNSHKYKVETTMNRKPATNVEIIDECDEFLDSFANEEVINLNRLEFELSSLLPENSMIREKIEEVEELVLQMIKDKSIKNNIEEEEIIEIKKTKMFEILKIFLDHKIMEYVECDEENYCYYIEETARNFRRFLDETYISFYKEDKSIIAKLVTTDLEERFRELLEKNEILILMSGTLHSESVLKSVFGIKEFKVIEAETVSPGKIDIFRTGKEADCSYDSFKRKRITREEYLESLSKCIIQSEKPLLVHVNSFKDLPSREEIIKFDLNIIPRERLKELQKNDSNGEIIEKFKKGQIPVLYTTRCSRGVDFPGDKCKSIIITRYPYPSVQSLFWRVLKKTKPEHYIKFYMDKARRELLQKIYRGLRHKKDHIYLLSPDKRILSDKNITSLQ